MAETTSFGRSIAKARQRIGVSQKGHVSVVRKGFEAFDLDAMETVSVKGWLAVFEDL